MTRHRPGQRPRGRRLPYRRRPGRPGDPLRLLRLAPRLERDLRGLRPVDHRRRSAALRLLARRALTRAGNVLLVTSGAGLIIVGLFPEDDAFLVHAVAAVVQIPAQGVALLLLGIGLVSSRRGLAVWTLACAAIALAGTVIFFSPLSGAVGYGLAERLALAPFMAWLVFTGAMLLGSEHRGRDWARLGSGARMRVTNQGGGPDMLLPARSKVRRR